MKIISWIKTFFLFGTMLSSSGNLFSQDGYNLYVSDLDNSQVFVFETNAPYTSTVIDLQTVHQLGGVGVTPAQTETYVGFQNNGTVSDEGIAVITNSATPSETYLNIDIFPHGFALTPDGTILLRPLTAW
jgi:DNA-binding beta-propeller fold protein YncE